MSDKEERKILETVIDRIASDGNSQYESVFVVCNDKDAEYYSQKLMIRYIGNYPESNAICVSAKGFGEELIRSIVDASHEGKNIRKGSAEKYSNADLLIMTCVDHISGNWLTQKELYVTVDKLFEKHKQVVFFSHLLPKDMISIEDRNRAQFEGSLILVLNRDS